MVQKLNGVSLDTLSPEEVRVCRDCGIVHVEDRGCPFCSLLSKAWKLKDSEKKASIREMVDWLYAEEPEEEKGFLG